MSAASFPVTGNPEMDGLLVTDAFALVLGMMLDQQVTMEKAFAGPYVLRERLGGKLEPATIVAADPVAIEEAFRAKPALHRYPAAMAKRAIALASLIVDDYDGDTAAIWTSAENGAELLRRLRALPGFGEGKAKIFLALLAKRLDVRPDGWEEAAGEFAGNEPRSVADVGSPEALAAVRAWKKEMKAKAKAAASST